MTTKGTRYYRKTHGRTGGGGGGSRMQYRHQQYELRKTDWAERNPGATPREYQDAMLRIATELGL